MSKMINSFDPSAAVSGTFDHRVSNPCGGVYLYNESNVWLQLRLPGGSYVGLPAWWSRFYPLHEVLEPIQWQELTTISTIATPLSQVYGEAYESSELKGRSFYDGPIPRNPYIANQVTSAVSTNQVVNDGNPATSTVMEATQFGNTGGSNLFAGNDGSFYYGQWLAGVYTKYFQGILGANPALVLGAKTFLQSYDQAGANLCNILGIDSGGNTFLQAHKTNNQVVIYDKNGAALLTVDQNACLKIAGVKQTLNGSTSGTMDVYEAFSGALKIVAVVQTNYQDTSTFKSVTLKTAFSTVAAILNFGCGGILTGTAGVADADNRQVTWGTGTAAGTQSASTGIPSDAAGFTTHGFTQVGNNNYASSHGGVCFLIGV
jgi:hypothetical protein